MISSPSDGQLFRQRGFDYRAAAGRTRQPLSALMWQSPKDWKRFGRSWLHPLLPAPKPKPQHDRYRYTVPVADPEDFQFILAGDTGMNSPEEYLVSSAISRSDLFPSEFLMLLGDVIYPAGGEGDYALGLLEAFRHYNQPILAVPGNHDWYDNLAAYERFFLSGKIRTESAQGYHWQCPKLPNWFYYFDPGESLRVICLDTGLAGEMRENRMAQLTWLDALLADSRDKKVIVMMHHPLVSLTARSHERGLQKLLMHRFQAAGVKAVFSGHDHNYQHHWTGANDGGMHHIINGAGGATLHALPKGRTLNRKGQPSLCLRKPEGAKWDTHHSFIHCHWQQDKLTCRVWSAHSLPPQEGDLLDEFTIQ